MGSSLAGSGVYNSSATAGALTQAQQNQQQSLADLSSRNFQDELAQWFANQRYLSGQRLGIANQDVGYQRDQRQQSLTGLASLLGRIVEGNKKQFGTDAGRKVGNAGNGMQNSVLGGVPDPYSSLYNYTNPLYGEQNNWNNVGKRYGSAYKNLLPSFNQ